MHFRRLAQGSFLVSAIALLSLPGAASARVIGKNVIAQSVTRERILASVPKKEQKAWRAYLQKSKNQQAKDKQSLKREERAAGVTDSKYAPHGFGRAMRMPHPEGWYTSPEALQIAHNVVTYQLPDGGWSKNVDMVSGPRAPGNRYDTNNLDKYSEAGDFDAPLDPNWNYLATLDNDATRSPIRFLAHVTTALLAAHRDADAAPFRAAVQRGVEYLLNAQYPNGGWPQVWPLEGLYHDAITLNDDAMLHAIEILHDVADGAPDYKFLPAPLATRAGAAAARGIATLLKLQVVEDGRKTAWADQYDPITLEPTSARNYEMPALTSGESASVVQFLMTLPNPKPREVAAVRDAAAWFKTVEIFGYRYGSGNFFADRRSPEGRKLERDPGAGPIWSRFYQIGTNKPIFGDRDQTIHDDVNDLSRERRNGYAWYSNEGVAVLSQFDLWQKSHPQ